MGYENSREDITLWRGENLWVGFSSRPLRQSCSWEAPSVIFTPLFPAKGHWGFLRTILPEIRDLSFILSRERFRSRHNIIYFRGSPGKRSTKLEIFYRWHTWAHTLPRGAAAERWNYYADRKVGGKECPVTAERFSPSYIVRFTFGWPPLKSLSFWLHTWSMFLYYQIWFPQTRLCFATRGFKAYEIEVWRYWLQS